MIGYRVSRRKLEALVEAERPGWLARAQERTSAFRRAGKYGETSSIWSEVKVVYMRLQGGSKCAFCERKLEAEEYGKGEQAVEHFRPKGNLKAWKGSGALEQHGITITPPPLKQGGYYLLAYNVFNYSAACNPCNSALKQDYFPIAGRTVLTGTSPEALLKENPLLIYPIGDFDDEPEELIRFHGLSPYAAQTSDPARHRALVTIEFFQLDSPDRKNLILERARILIALHPALRTLSGEATEEDRQLAQEIVEGLTKSSAAHANCARSFVQLYRDAPGEAREIFGRAVDVIRSTS